MITVISGGPGAGKTAHVVSMLADLFKEAEKAGKPPRRVYTMGIPELSLPTESAGAVSGWTVMETSEDDPDLKEAQFTFEEGSLVVVDEAQKVYRPRAPGTKVPPHVSAFERHRHKGLDFWLVTQFPNLLESNVRQLCTRHIHVRASWSGRKLYEWVEVANPLSPADRDRAASRPYKLPSHVFSLYKSASLHVSQKRKKPLIVYGLAAMLVALIGLGWYISGRLASKTSPQSVVQGGGSGSDETWVPPGPKSAPPGGGVSELPRGGLPLATLEPSGIVVADWVPRLAERPETAPLYDHLRVAAVMPVVAGCVQMGEVCRCVTQQGTDAFLGLQACQAWIEKTPFRPWSPEVLRPPDRPTGQPGGRAVGRRSDADTST